MLSLDHLDDLMAIEPSPRYLIAVSNIRERTHESDAVLSIKTTANLIRAISKSTDVLFTLKRGRNGVSFINATHIGKRLIDTIGRDLPRVEEYLAGNGFNTYYRLLQSATQPVPDIHERARYYTALIGDEAALFYKQITDVVEQLRAESKTDRFLSDLDARRRQCQANHQSAKDYINFIFDHRASKNLAVRIDLVTGGETAESRGITNSVSLDQAKVEFNRFIRFARKRFPVTGWMASLEYGVKTGYHYHVLIFLNGHMCVNDINNCRILGEHWSQLITEGRGRYYNCNANSYIQRGIGMISHYDSDKRRILVDHVVSYLTKTDFWIKFAGTGRTFNKGPVPEEERNRMIPKGGRPRKTVNP